MTKQEMLKEILNELKISLPYSFISNDKIYVHSSITDTFIGFYENSTEMFYISFMDEDEQTYNIKTHNYTFEQHLGLIQTLIEKTENNLKDHYRKEFVKLKDSKFDDIMELFKNGDSDSYGINTYVAYDEIRNLSDYELISFHHYYGIELTKALLSSIKTLKQRIV